MIRVVLLGMVGPFAGPALAALLGAGAEVVAVAVPAPPGAPPVAPAPRLAPTDGHLARGAAQPVIALGSSRVPSHLDLAAARGLPALALRHMAAPAVREALADLAPDLLAVACWPWRLPPALLAVPRLGALNLHPSLLPELRGPEPLFWALREGHEQSAVTLHWMDEGLDTGPIALQRPLALPVGLGWAEVEAAAAALGAELWGEAGAMLEFGSLPRLPQGPGGSYRPSPGPGDFAIDPAWPAARAFRFMRGTAAWGQAYTVWAGERGLSLGAALAYDPGGELGAAYRLDGEVAHIQMRPGVLVANLALSR